MTITLDKRFRDRLRGRFGKYDFQVGVFTDSGYKLPKRGERGKRGADVLSSYAGGPVRKKSGTDAGITIAQVSKENRKRLGFNYLTKPFEKKSSDIVKFTREFFRLAFGRSEKRRAENLLQAIVRNPILRGDYGPNSTVTKAIKGFDRGMIDTAQLFKSLVSRCVIRGGR